MAAEQPGSPEGLSGRRVLVVDDDSLIRGTVELALSLEGVKVTLAENGEKALEIIEKLGAEKPDLILTDYRMPPGMTGVELIEKIREMGLTIPTILVSGDFGGLSDEDVQAKAEELGASAGISKPFSLETLLSTAQNLINPKPQDDRKGSFGICS